MITSVFYREPVQADRLLGAADPAMVQATEEPGPAELTEKVSRGQVNSKDNVFLK